MKRYVRRLNVFVRRNLDWWIDMRKIDKPLFKSVPTYRNYEDYHDAEQYVRGWNDAMRFIFGIEESDNSRQQIWKDIINKSGKESKDVSKNDE